MEQRKKYARSKEVHLAQVASLTSKAESKDGRASARRGERYEAFCEAGWPRRIQSGEVTVGEVVGLTGESQPNVSRWYAAWLEDGVLRLSQEQWSRDELVEHLLSPTVEAFAAFRCRFFTDEWGQPYLTPEFHLRWIAVLLDTMEEGRRTQILSPPRHGKTQLLIHFCVWLICRNPNVRIIWIGLNEDNAREALGAVKDILEHEESLREAVLGPGREWKPPARGGKGWTDKVFTVGNRDVVGIKAPTMRAVGKGGKLLSKDADLIVGDDIQDQEAHSSPASREKDRHWVNTQISSRKEAHTGLALIGSRQDHEDLYGSLFSNPRWTSIVEHAHYPACQVPIHPPRDEHDADCPDCALHVGCVLWPEKRTMAFLQDQRVAMDDDVVFDMVYNNVTRPGGAAYVTADAIEQCKTHRTLTSPLPAGRMIAGLDPASVGMQAAFLWVFNPQTKVRHAIDVDNRPAGSTAGAREIIKSWFERYRCQHWVIERNNFQLAILQDPDLKAYCNDNGIILEAHFTTQFNKWDENFGVPKQLEAFGSGLIDIPWGDEDTRERFREAIKQWLAWHPQSKGKTDIAMAAWFPERHFKNWRLEVSSRARFSEKRTGYFGSSGADGYTKVAM